MSKNGLVNETAAVQKVRTATCPTLCFLQVAPLPVGSSFIPPFLLSNLENDVLQGLRMSGDKSLSLPGRRFPLSVISSRRLAASTLCSICSTSSSDDLLHFPYLLEVVMKLLVDYVKLLYAASFSTIHIFWKSSSMP
jgi:hypothetical protein